MDFESSFKGYLKKQFLKAPYPPQKLLRKSLLYSLLAKASRFRPRLCFATARTLGQNPKKNSSLGNGYGNATLCKPNS